MRPDAFERLFEEHAQGLLAFLAYRTGDRALAEDLVADTFERVYKARRRFDPRRSSEKTWIYSIALNRLRDHQRRKGTEERALEQVGADTGEDVRSETQTVEDRDALQRALAELADEEREAVALRYGADLTVPEIAKVLRQPVSTAEGRVYRALRKLRDALD